MSLPISSIVDVSISTSPIAPTKIGFGIVSFVSDELPISGLPAPLRVKYFNSITEIEVDYAVGTEVHSAASAYFSQSPSPTTIGVIAQYLTPTFANLFSGTTVDTDLSVWQAIPAGSFGIGISGITVQVTAIDFSGIASMVQVASVIETAINSADASLGYTLATVTWDATNNRFIIVSGESAQSINFTTTGGTGTDVSPLMKTEAADGGNIVNGSGPETPLDALIAADNFDKGWYGIALDRKHRDLQMIEDVALWVEARVKVFMTTSHNPNSLLQSNIDCVGARLNASGYQKTLAIYSSFASQYPEMSAFGRAFTVDFNAPDSVITLKFKVFPGINTEALNSSQKTGLDQKRMNAYISVGGADMFAESFMAAQLFFDERHGIDWLTGELEFETFAYLLSKVTKVPLTDAGTTATVQQVIKVLDRARRNGMIAPGTNSNGEFLENGYRVTYGKVADQSIADKQARIQPAIIFNALFAGAAHFVEIRGTLER